MKSYVPMLATAVSITALALTPAEKKEIGLKIWRNEGSQKYEYLAFWNAREPFPSFGIGHFIWYPAGIPADYDQTFPELIDLLIARKINVPTWLQEARMTGAPWKTKAAFDSSPLLKELRDLLGSTIDIQADYCITRLEKKWPAILAAADPTKRARINRAFNELLKSPQGAYALIDYLNFKGAGINPNERYDGIGWGVLQVMEALPERWDSSSIVQAFAQNAQQVLKNRVAHAPPDKKLREKEWLTGWLNRLATYLS